MVSLWWVAAAFFVGGYAGVVLVAVMSMAARQTGDACQPRGSGGSSPERPAGSERRPARLARAIRHRGTSCIRRRARRGMPCEADLASTRSPPR